MRFSLNLAEKLRYPQINMDQSVGDFLADVAKQTIAQSPHVDIVQAFLKGNPATRRYNRVSRRGLELLIERRETAIQLSESTSAPEL